MAAPTLLADALCFGEGPRWHDGALWLSDMHAHEVLRISPAGNKAVVVRLDDAPSGLGWLPDGTLLIVSMTRRQLLRFDGTRLSLHADLAALAPFHCNDMVVDAAGRAYVGNFGFDLHGGATPVATNLIMVQPDGSAVVAADDLTFPNGTVITPDDRTLIVAESFGRRLTAFDKAADGTLSNRRNWADMPQGAVPDGICLDSAGGIWVASPTTNECLRVCEGGEVTHRIPTDRGAFACMLSEDSLYILTSKDSDPKFCSANRTARIEVHSAPFPRAGWP